MAYVIEWIDTDPNWRDGVKLAFDGDLASAIDLAMRMSQRETEVAKVYDDGGRCVYDTQAREGRSRAVAAEDGERRRSTSR